MTIYLLAFLIGIIAGLRTMTALAAASWAAYLGMIDVSASPFAFMGYRYTPWIFSVLAVAELFADQHPAAPSRKVPLQFGARIVSGALAGATLAATGGMWVIGAVLGAIGAVIGTLGGAAGRARLAAAFGRDLPAALVEDAVAIAGAVLIVMMLP
jgi:uncharacterized membrane protein